MIRATKCLRLQARGLRFQSTTVRSLLKGDEVGKSVKVTGWIHSKRKHGKAIFLDVVDGSSHDHVQVVTHSLSANANIGASVLVQGLLNKSRGEQQNVELQAKNIWVLGECPLEPPFPIQFKSVHSADYLRTHQHLRPRTSHFQSVLRLRSDLVAKLHQFFNSRQFYYTNPPIITRSDAEGAGESFAVSTIEKDFFGLGKDPRLTVSTQLHLEALMHGLGRVWTLSPTFRAEKSDTSRHLSEFWMLEAEWIEDELEGIMTLVEDMIRSIVVRLQEGTLTHLMTEMDKQDNTIPVEEISERWEKLKQPNWQRMTYKKALERLKEEHQRNPFKIPPNGHLPLASAHEQFLASQSPTPIFITHYPRKFKPFYMLRSQNGDSTVENFDLLMPGMGEIAGGSLRVHDIHELEKAMEKHRMNKEDYDWYLELRKWGSVPHGGFGLGIDRLIGYLAGITNVREVVAFPRMFSKSGCLN